ncbi:hypothetical protein Ptr902_03801 [Pyrenophora tritici-repentis]|nr:hypothetical protein Ptr902_13801 [Pyrenophora tritici-repentis]KAI2484861.1 hypothetical protein Ptr902_03801 [Pyrenophora tritici-repentis]
MSDPILPLYAKNNNYGCTVVCLVCQAHTDPATEPACKRKDKHRKFTCRAARHKLYNARNAYDAA